MGNSLEWSQAAFGFGKKSWFCPTTNELFEVEK